MAKKKSFTPISKEEFERNDKGLPGLFEIKTCGRCGGSGSYSFNMMDGDRCYGCGGSGKKWTARGKRQRAKYIELQSIPAKEVEPGMNVFLNNYWRKVLEVKPDTQVWTMNGERQETKMITICYRARAAGQVVACQNRVPEDEPVRKTWDGDTCYRQYVEALKA